jgi:putative ABC transport system permease protein
MKVVILGIVVGLAGALLVTRLMSSLLFGVDPLDALTFAAVGTVLAGAAVLACVVPARRAVRLEPAAVLRNE